MMNRIICLLLLGGLCLTSETFADEIRPGYLELKETSPNVFSVLWKVPAKGDKKLSLKAQLPAGCKNKTPLNGQFVNGAYIQRWMVDCEDGLIERSISIEGLESTNTDVLLRMEFMDGASQSVRLTPSERSFHIPAEASSLQIIGTYTWLGVEHILLGIDHLLFVFALLLIVKDLRRLIWTVTAFTVAHSITLAGATLGYLHAPQQPVEAIIALSIVFLAVEIIHGQQGQPRLTHRAPWIVAFSFGLLHGFGFAGALSEVGLPQNAIPLALLFFNLGVEIGQLLFVATVVLLTKLISAYLSRMEVTKFDYPAWGQRTVAYVIGPVAFYWVIERTTAFIN
jgi:hydrogenase/urease accessory protein HupE